MPIEFHSDTQTATFYNPLEDFAETDVEVEIRTDPLTDRQTRIVPEAFVMPEETPSLPDSVTDSSGCFFCPDMVTDATPEYPDSISFDRGSVGEATSFPNLNPYASHSNVVALTEDHYVPIDELSADILADGLQAAFEYVQAVFAADETASIASVNMNLLPTAGSSIIHPHMQAIVDDRGTTSQKRRLEGAETYVGRTGESYFDAVLEATRGTDRYIGSTRSVDWLAPFAPRHHRHVRGILPESDCPSPDDSVLESVADGIERVLAAYAAAGLNSFNVGFHCVRDGRIKPHVDIVARSVFERYAWSDATFFETVHDESVIDESPETYGPSVAEFFEG